MVVAAVNIIISTLMFAIGYAGFIGNVLVMLTLLVNKHLKEPSSMLMMSAALSDTGHGLIIICHVAPELATGEIAWGETLEILISHTNLLFWYASLGSFFFMALNRYFAVCRPIQAKEIFKLSRVLAGLAIVWMLSLGMSLLPLRICCRKIFDIHFEITTEESHEEATNVIKLITHIADGTVLIVMFVCYYFVYFGRKFGGTERLFHAGQNSTKNKTKSQADKIVRNITTQFMAVSVVFALLSILQVVTQYVEKNRAIISLLQVSLHFIISNKSKN